MDSDATDRCRPPPPELPAANADPRTFGLEDDDARQNGDALRPGTAATSGIDGTSWRGGMAERAQRAQRNRTRATTPERIVEAQLLERARAGDRDAFEALAVRAMPRMLGTASRLLGPGFAAEEAVSEALFRAYRHIKRFRGSSAFSTWLHRIVCRVVADRFRESARDRRLHTRVAERIASGLRPSGHDDRRAQPLDRLSGRETAARLRRIASELPPTQRLVLLLFAWEGLALADIAALLSLKYATVKSHLHHARTALRSRLGPHGDDV